VTSPQDSSFHPASRRDTGSAGRVPAGSQHHPVGDAIIVLRGNGPKATVYGVHAVTAAVMLAAATFLYI